MQKIKELEQQENEASTVPEEAPQKAVQMLEAPSVSPSESEVLQNLLAKHQELQRMRAAIGELGMGGPPEQAARHAEVERRRREETAQTSEQEMLMQLMQKRDQLLGMQTAIQNMQRRGETAGKEAKEALVDEQEDDDDDEDDDSDSGNDSDAEQDDDDEDENGKDGEGRTASEADILELLAHKHKELLQMRTAISQLREHEKSMQVPQPAPPSNAVEESGSEEEDLLSTLRQKREDLLKMQTALAELEKMRNGVQHFESEDQIEEIEEAQDNEDSDEHDDDDVEEIALQDDVGEAEQLQAMFARLMAKKQELDSLRSEKTEMETQMRSVAAMPKEVTYAREAGRATEDPEMLAILQHRAQAQEAVAEQERKIAELTSLQETLRSRLNEMEALELSAAPPSAAEESEEEEDAEEQEDIAEQLLELLSVKTHECQQLALVVKEARDAGMDAANPQLRQAERDLALRYAEVKQLAAYAHQMGRAVEGATDTEAAEKEESEDDEDKGLARDSHQGGQVAAVVTTGTAAAHARAREQDALENVTRLEDELRTCVEGLRTVDATAGKSICMHPAYRQMRDSVQQKMESLNAQLVDARAIYEDAVKNSELPAEDEEAREMDLTPLLKECLDKLWGRSYQCRVFTLQLLQGLADLDDSSLCMMSSCFARYLENHSVTAS